MYNFYPKNWGYVRSRHIARKLLLIMKLTTLILVTVILHVSASSLAQKITLVEKNAPLVDVFDHISNQTGYDFLFTGSDLKNAKLISIDVKNVDLNEVLDKIFSGQPLSYTIENKSVVVSIKEKSLLNNLSDKVKAALKIPADIGGTVTDTLDNPLVGASVSIKGTNFTTKTDGKGSFNFSNVEQGKYTLVVSYVGYEKAEVTIINTGTNTRVGLVLRPGTSQLDQVRVIAYGTDSRRFSVGSVATVTAEDIEKQPVTNPLLALQGQVAGLVITSTSGIPGSQVTAQVRGQNTLFNTTLSNPLSIKPYDQPLFIIDGVPFAAQNNNINQLASLVQSQTYNNGSYLPSGGFSPFNNINPADIESISILKDADATSIYGTQGSNGVILITTKKGNPGPAHFDLNVNTSFNSAADPVQLLNTQQYLQLRKDAFTADGTTPTINPYAYPQPYAPDVLVFDQNKYTDWEKIILGKTTNNTDVHGSLSGGTANNTFLMSAGYDKSTYNYPGDFADQRFTFHSNIHHVSNNRRLTVDMTTDFGYDQNNSALAGGAQDVVLPPNLPNLLTPSGGLVWNYQGVDLTSDQFYAGLQQPTTTQNYNFNGSLRISYKIVDGLTIAADLGYNRNTTDEHLIYPVSAQNPAGYNVISTATFANTTYQTVNVEPQIKYNKNFGKGIFSALIGSTYKKNTNYANQIEGSGYSNDNLLGSLNGASTLTAFDNANIYRYSAGFGRLNYIYNSEFIVDLSGRRDGSSNFGPDRQFGNFGAVGAGWIFSEEKMFKKSPSVFSYGKLSGSYGTTGTDGIQAYQFNSLYRVIGFFPPFQGSIPTSPYNAYNPDFGWATKKSLNLALDLGFFNNRLLFNATYYRDRESDQLVNYPLPVQTGFGSVLGNSPATVQNQGLEFSINSTNIKTKDFLWRTNFNVAFNRNKLIAFPDLANSTYSSQYIIGQPTSEVFGYKYKDVNPTTGLFEFYAKDGSVTSNPNYGPASLGGDEVPIASQEVRYTGGIGNNFSYKHFSLSIFCQFSSQNAPNYLAQSYTTNPLGFEDNQPTAVLGTYWKAPGDVAQLQRLSSGYSSQAINSFFKFGESSGVYGDDTYLRVKTVALSYQLPDAFVKTVHIKAGSVFMNAQNLLTFTDYKVGDPELPGSYTSFPIQRILAFGLNLKF
jgi:TonB-dependent starch-binding outer membrane protein SusC